MNKKEFPNTDVTDLSKEEAYKRIATWCSKGYTIHSIAAELGVSYTIFNRWQKEDPKIKEAMIRGNKKDEQLCMNRLRAIAFNDDHAKHLTALLAYGKIKHRWNDGSRLDEAKTSSLPSKIPADLDDVETAT